MNYSYSFPQDYSGAHQQDLNRLKAIVTTSCFPLSFQLIGMAFTTKDEAYADLSVRLSRLQQSVSKLSENFNQVQKIHDGSQNLAESLAKTMRAACRHASEEGST